MPTQTQRPTRSPKRQPKAAADSVGPRYITMATEFRDRISAGELRPGDRLPSFAEMRNQHGSTVATVERVYGMLEREGLVERRQGIGTFVTAPRHVQTGNIGFVGCAVWQAAQMAYYANLMEGVQTAMEAHGRHLLSLGGGKTWSREALPKVDGILLCNLGNAEHIISDLPPGTPCVSMLTTAEGVTSIVTDEYGAAKQAMEYLLSLGHRRIACLMEQRPPQPRLRIAAYNDTLMKAGIVPDPRWMCRTRTDVSYVPAEIRQTYMEWGYESVKAWLQEDWASLGCTAIFVQNDTAAVGVLQALQEAGIKVPDDVSVVGFDGTEVCEYTNPRLTAVEVPLVKIGAKAVETLLQQIDGRQAEQDTHVVMLPTRIKEGESTAPPRAS